MNKFITLALFFSVIFTFSSAHAHEKITLCYEDQDYPPYLVGASQGVNNQNSGVLVDLSRKAFKEAGITVDFVRRPWKRCMRMVEQNKAAGMFGVIYRKEREKIGRYPFKSGEIDPSRRFLSVEYPVFHHKDITVSWDGKSFISKDIKIGTPLGYDTVKSLKIEHNIDANINFLPEKGLALVAQKKLDGYILEKNVGLQLLRKQNLIEKVIPHQSPFKQHNLYLFLSHGFYESHTEEAEKVWTSLAVLRKTVLDELMRTYLSRQ